MLKDTQLIGIVWMVLHCLFISILSAFIRILAKQFSIAEIIFYYNFFALLFFLPWVGFRNILSHLKTRVLRLHLLRALLGAISLFLYFYSLTLIPLTNARAIVLAGPLVSSCIAILFLKEKIGWHRSIALIAGFFGALLILDPGHFHFALPYVYILCAIMMWAVMDLITKILGRTEPTTTLLLYLMGGMTVFSFPGAAFYWHPPAMDTWIWLIALGGIFLFDRIAIVHAFKHADITTIMPFDFSGMVFTTIIAYYLFGETLDTRTALGAFIIMASSIYMAHREAKKARAIYAHPLQSEN